MSRLLLIFNLSTVVFASCEQIADKKVSSTDSFQLKNEAPDTGNWSKPVIESVKLNFQTTFRFDDISATIIGLESDEQKVTAENGADTITITRQDLGLIPFGTSISVQSANVTNIGMEYSFRNVAGVRKDGGICCLYGWKQVNSPWLRLKQTESRDFIIPQFNAIDQEKFSKVSLKEWKEEVKKHCGAEYFQNVEKLSGMRTLPAFVALDEIYYRISGTDSSGEKISKIIQIIVPID